mgnify:CR=1 FL=1
MSLEDNLLEQRVKRTQEIEALGFHAYGRRYDFTHTVAQVLETEGAKTAEDGGNVGISVSEQEERRTGARVFVRSGAVGDDPLVLWKTELSWIGFKFTKLDIDRAWNMAGLKCLFTAYIHNDG